MNDPPDGDVLSLNADSLTLTAECNHVLYKPCIVININKPHGRRSAFFLQYDDLRAYHFTHHY